MGPVVTQAVVENEPDLATARLFRVLGDGTRLSILERLLVRSHTVSELVEAIQAPQNRVSTHLACLRWCGFVEATRQGRHVTYSICDPDIGRLIDVGKALSAVRFEHLATCRRIGPEWV